MHSLLQIERYFVEASLVQYPYLPCALWLILYQEPKLKEDRFNDRIVKMIEEASVFDYLFVIQCVVELSKLGVVNVL